LYNVPVGFSRPLLDYQQAGPGIAGQEFFVRLFGTIVKIPVERQSLMDPRADKL
jgi:hypothetical protein